MSEQQFQLREAEGVRWLEVPLASARAVFTTRLGGVSTGPWASLNLGYTVGDDPQRVGENVARLCRALGIDPRQLAAARQVHGARTVVLDRKHAGAGMVAALPAAGEGDVLLAPAQGPWPVVKLADCLAVLIADAKTGALAAVHAGWRGTAARVAARALEEMARIFRTEPRDCQVALGPCVGPCCYTVGEDVARAFAGDLARALRRDEQGAFRLDLALANRWQLERAGVPPEHIVHADLCTSCRADFFFSHRRDRGKTGRQAAILLGERPRK